MAQLYGSGIGLHAQLMLIFSAATLYVAGKGAVDAMSGDQNRPGLRALGHFLPIAMTSITAIILHQPAIALAVIFSTSVGALSLVNGSALAMEEQSDAAVPPPSARAWPLLAVPATLVFLAGFESRFTLLDALLLMGMGLVILSLAISGAASRIAPAKWNLTLAVVLGACGAFIAVKATVVIATNLNLPTPQLIAGSALGPLLVLPMILTGATAVRRYGSPSAVASGVMLVMLNLCGLMPACILISRLIQGPGSSLIYPLSLWRVDAAFLVLLSLLLFPASQSFRAKIGWTWGKIEALLLILFYLLYIVLASVAAASG